MTVQGSRFRLAVTVAACLGAGLVAKAQVVSNLIDPSRGAMFTAAIDGPGAYVYAVSSTNQLGTNPQFTKQIFRWNATTGAGVQLTQFPAGVESVSVSDDGQWLAFISHGDLRSEEHTSELQSLRHLVCRLLLEQK